MLRFFRHIRQKFLQEGKASRFIGYALGEIVLIVVGIMIALQLGEWNEDRVDRRTEATYITELLEDFQANRKELEENITSTEDILTAMIGLINQSNLETPAWTLDEISEAFKLVQAMPTFAVVDRSYTNLVGSGDLKVLQSLELKNALALYYSRYEVVSIVQSTHEMELVQTFQPYIIESLDYQAVSLSRVKDFPLPPSSEKAQILDVLKTRKFRNIVTQKWTICHDLLDQFRTMLIRNEEIYGRLNSLTDK